MPTLLITNDDGIHAPGLAALQEALAGMGDLYVVAPDTERSAAGHAITMLHILRVWDIYRNGGLFGRAVNGTPADCVKLAVSNLLAAPPDLVISGINPGPNTGTNVLYSGTVSAAMEGTIYGIPSLAVSMGSLKSDQDYRPAQKYARLLAEEILKRGLPSGVMLNLNVPSMPLQEIKGIRITRQASFKYKDKYEKRRDPRGRDYYWLSLEDAEICDPAPDADALALEEGYASLTPLHCNLTNPDFMRTLHAWPLPK
ncbi:5'/3'-nucleotidase SurE [candidate division FCPU426 bacterium]|nr:5'/3'-nucleotidase SurE [candidate division FCPU426 bacterium]